jgi:hypothetical protein
MKIGEKQFNIIPNEPYTVIHLDPGKTYNSAMCGLCSYVDKPCSGTNCGSGYSFLVDGHDDAEITAKLTVMRMEGKI